MAIKQWKLYIDNILQKTLTRLEIINTKALQMKEWIKTEVVAMTVPP